MNKEQALDRIVDTCPTCEGNGYEVEERTWTDSAHAPNCDGYTCGSTCPIPVQMRESERVDCPICGGRGWTPNPEAVESAALKLTQYGVSQHVSWTEVDEVAAAVLVGLVDYALGGDK